MAAKVSSGLSPPSLCVRRRRSSPQIFEIKHFEGAGAKIWANCFVSAANLWIIVGEVRVWAVGSLVRLMWAGRGDSPNRDVVAARCRTWRGSVTAGAVTRRLTTSARNVRVPAAREAK